MQNNLTVIPLIGLEVKIVHSTNSSQKGLVGQVVNETHGTIVLSDGNRSVIIPKDVVIFEVALPNGRTLQVNGKTIVGHPAERIRRAKRQRW
jgi:RNase P/RNase MRP subunit p29